MIWGLLIVLAAGLVLLALISKPRGGHGRPNRQRLNREATTERWQAIEQMAASGGPGLRNAISEADKLLDHAMRASGFRGNTMGERLKSDGNRFSDLDGIWRAHKLRNTLAHELNPDLVPSQAKEAIASFLRGLKDLGAL